jgi:molecular chaperone GrpE
VSGTDKGSAGADKSSAPADGTEAQQPPLVIRDRRRIRKNDPIEPPQAATAPEGSGSPDANPAVEAQEEESVVIGEVIEPSEAPDAALDADPAPGPLGAELAALRAELDERFRDLQRVTAEYANYRKRVDRDRALVGEQATGGVLVALLPVLDDLDRAREHGDLVGPFGSVAEQIVGSLTKFGLTAFGEKGDPFDPTLHEAVAHLTSAEVTEPTCVDILRRGYLLGERLLRPALVAVADPE